MVIDDVLRGRIIYFEEEEMTKLEQIKEAIESLPPHDFTRLRKWFADKDWGQWDRRIARDSEAGKLDALIKEAREEKRGGKLGNL